MGSAASAGKSQRPKRSCLLGLEILERVDFNKLYERVEFLLGVLVLVSLAGDADTDFTRDVSDSGSPDLTVKVGVHAHFLNAREKLTSALIISVSPCYADCLEGGDNCQIWRAEAKLTLVNISLVANLLMFPIAQEALFLNWMT